MAGQWNETEIAGHPADVFEPSRRNEQGDVVIYLHGVHLQRLRDHAAFTDELERYGLPAICPMTARSWWTDKICPEFDPQVTAEQHVRQQVLAWIEAQYGSRPPQIALLGTSMGGQGALRFAMKYPDTFPVVAAIAPAIDYHLRWDEGDETLPTMYADKEAARQDTAILHLHPLNWPRNLWFCCDPTDRWHDSAQRLQMKLAALGIPHQCDLETEAGGHTFTYYSHMAPAAFQFLQERLDHERRRVR